MIRILIAALFLLAASPTVAQVEDPAGSWAIKSEGRILMLLELRHDPSMPGGWAGVLARPEHFTITGSHVALDVSGPVISRPILSASMRGRQIALVIQARAADAEADTFLFNLLDASHAEFGWDDPRFPPMAMARAGTDARVAADWTPGEHPLATPYPTNSEMTALFEADQADRRGGITDARRAEVIARDAARRARIRALLDAGALRSGTDFWHAAFIFQHGGSAENYLLAHSFAVIAASRGRPDAAWIAAATLDRYLQTIGRAQVFGTQCWHDPPTRDPYDRAVLPDSVRQAAGVPPLAEQGECPR